MTDAELAVLDAAARRIRGSVVGLSHRARTAHLGSSLSCVDILVAAYWKALRIDPKRADDPGRDRLVFSKGHAAMALYSTLSERGFFDAKLLEEYGVDGGRLPEHPSPGCLPGIEVATGSLGHGLSWGVGMSLASRLQERACRVFVVLSDGDCEEGSTWEAAMFAPIHKLSGLTAIVDFNKWQATGRSREIMALEPLSRKWESFGWAAREVDGHDLRALTDALCAPPDAAGRPTAIVAHTIKGKGVSFMEDDNNWHYRSPNADELAKARAELGLP
ncbi:MAG: transketolase [Elusimicrobia bacterium RIFOXYD12_FULL_66_9]|nr:MAG: transketolase [Elusimicrobia bacterium RIFOXYD12_FULL_66_9]